jgi:hypothetical protein
MSAPRTLPSLSFTTSPKIGSRPTARSSAA